MTLAKPADEPRGSDPAIAPERGATDAEELAYRLRQQELAAEFGLLALGTHDVHALLREATRVCGKGMQAKLCRLMQNQPEEGDLLMRTGVDLGSPAGHAFHTGESLISNHLQGEIRFRTPQILAIHGVKLALSASPIFAGCVGSRHARPDDFRGVQDRARIRHA